MLYVDLDGVFADFTSAACQVHAHPHHYVSHWDFFTDWTGEDGEPMTEEQFMGAIHARGDNFYRFMVKPYSWVPEMLDLITKADKWAIVTSAPSHYHGFAAKKIWVDKYLQPFVKDPIEIIVCTNKWRLATQDTLLIDDYDRNLGAFDSVGGHILPFPQPWNTTWYAGGDSRDRMSFISKRLKHWRTFRHVY